MLCDGDGMVHRLMLDNSWDNKQIILHLGAVKSAFYLYVNGKSVGYSEDSKTAAEFDITDFVNVGENTIAMQVVLRKLIRTLFLRNSHKPLATSHH